MFTYAGQAGTNDIERSNVHCFIAPPVFWQCNFMYIPCICQFFAGYDKFK